MHPIKLNKLFLAVWIIGWSLALYYNLFQAFNIWGIVYPFLSILEEMILCFDDYLPTLIPSPIILVRLLQNIIIIFLLLLTVGLLLFLFLDFYGVFHPHGNDYFCTADGICDDDLFTKQLGIIVKASLLTVIDFIWVKPIAHKLMIILNRF